MSEDVTLTHLVVAMLGVVGWVVPEVFRLPAPYFKALDPVAAHDYFVSTGGMSQILLAVSFLEIIGAIALRETLEGDREPGYFGFDPLGLGKSPELFKKYQVNEIKNGRLAMIAFGGFYHSFLMTHQGVIDNLTHFKAIPGHVF